MEHRVANIDIEPIIVAIRKRPALWDDSNKERFNRKSKETLWQEVSREVNATVLACKNKWHGIRDVYRRELIRGRSTWKHHKQLEFLKVSPYHGSANKRRTKNGVDSETSEGEENVLLPGSKKFRLVARSAENSESFEINDDDNDNDENSFMLKTEEVFLKDPLQLPVVAKLKLADAAPKSGKDKSSMQTSEGMSAQDNSGVLAGDTDADYMFLMSLLPFLRAIPLSRKMQVRMKLQNVFCEEITSDTENLLEKLLTTN